MMGSVTYYCPCGFVGHSLDEIDAHKEAGPVEPDSCCNCGGMRCMGCVCRDWYHDCEDDCPVCCEV